MKKVIMNTSIWRIILAIVRLYLGWSWLHAGFEKLMGSHFSAAGFIKGALTKTSGPHPAVQFWWADFLQHVAIPNITVFNDVIPWGEFLVGLSLILGVFTKFGVLMGIVMNFSYMFSGSVSVNPQMLLLEIIVFIHSAKAAYFGLDYWVMPKFRQLVSSWKAADFFSRESESA